MRIRPPDDTKSPELRELPAVFEQTFQVENGICWTQSKEQSELPKTGSKRKPGSSPLLAMNDKVFPENPEHDGPNLHRIRELTEDAFTQQHVSRGM